MVARVTVLNVTTGSTVATCTARLLNPLTVTVADKLSANRPLRFPIVNCVVVALVIFPVTPLLKVTVLLVAVLEKPKPWMVKVVALAARVAVLAVTTGFTVATCTAVPLF